MRKCCRKPVSGWAPDFKVAAGLMAGILPRSESQAASEADLDPFLDDLVAENGLAFMQV